MSIGVVCGDDLIQATRNGGHGLGFRRSRGLLMNRSARVYFEQAEYNRTMISMFKFEGKNGSIFLPPQPAPACFAVWYCPSLPAFSHHEHIALLAENLGTTFYAARGWDTALRTSAGIAVSMEKPKRTYCRGASGFDVVASLTHMQYVLNLYQVFRKVPGHATVAAQYEGV